jgi:uncharacterized membrane protein YoaT (DUF817 family)
MKTKKIILIHTCLLVFLIALLIIFSENILNFFASGFHDIEMWLFLILGGSISIFILLLISCIILIALNRRKIKMTSNIR